MSSQNRELRYLVQVSNEFNDSVKREVFELILEEGDFCIPVSELYDQIDSTNRTIRRHIADSRIIEREQSQGISLVYCVDDTAEKALRVSQSCIEANEQKGLPQGDKL